MAGTFQKAARPRRPGAYFNFQAREAEPVLRNTLGTLMLPFTHSWGPSETVVELNSFSEFTAIFGQGGTVAPVYTEGYKAVRQAFLGEGLVGRGGAGTVLGYRITGSSAAKASKSISNGATPAITLTARYEGTFGNTIKYIVVPDAAQFATKDNLVVVVGSTEVERYSYAKTDITALAAAINSTLNGSAWVTASAVTSGTALTASASSGGIPTPTQLTGGDDGLSLQPSDWAAFMAAAEPQRFSLLSFANLTDTSVLATVVAWAKGLNSRGKRFMSVVGGGTTSVPDTVSDAAARSATINDPNFVNIGGGVYTDEVLGDLTPAQLAPRVAGVLAAKGERESLTFARLAGLSIKTGPTELEILAALDGGVVTIARDSNRESPLRLEKGLTTFISKTDTERPFRVYSVPKFVRTMHSIETEITEFAESNVIGRLPVNQATRDYLVGSIKARLAARESDAVIQRGWTVAIDDDPPPSDDDEFIGLIYSLKFGRALEQVFNTIVVG